ncbi:MAG: hypothetical protein QNL04_08805, partial [SAR324 cluster bacterium]|nr:hypothetical protein [SAR324 cluster bacterium]
EMMPFILADSSETSLTSAYQKLESGIKKAGFNIVGSFEPYTGGKILVATNKDLKTLAAMSENGGFGAMVRASVTLVGKNVQTSYTNLRYNHAVYQMKGDMGPIADALEAALGKAQEFGPGSGLTAKQLAGYHYKFSMPYFDDVDELAEFESHEAALAAVEAGLASNAGGTSKVYRIDLDGKQESVFGVAMTVKLSSDETIMKEIDFKELRSTPHLPYELLVVGNKVIALSAKFRIALSFPDLSMMGANSFMNIMDSPDDIKSALAAAAMGK